MKRIVITGASDGIGKVCAKMLVEKGYEVIITGRNKDKTIKVANELNCKYYVADFLVLDEVKKLADELNKLDRIDCLINNAGAVFNERKETINNIERTFQLNCLSMFLLNHLLMDKLEESKATVISTTSIAANLMGKEFDVNDIENKLNYKSTKAYGESKLIDIILTKEFHKRFNDKNVSFTAFEPGIPRTNFANEGNKFMKFCYHSPLKYIFTSNPKKSAKRMMYLALGVANKDFNSGSIYKNNGKVYKEKFNVSLEDMDKTYDYCISLVKEYL